MHPRPTYILKLCIPLAQDGVQRVPTMRQRGLPLVAGSEAVLPLLCPQAILLCEMNLTTLPAWTRGTISAPESAACARAVSLRCAQERGCRKGNELVQGTPISQDQVVARNPSYRRAAIGARATQQAAFVNAGAEPAPARSTRAACSRQAQPGRRSAACRWELCG